MPGYEDLRSEASTLGSLGAVTPDAYIVQAETDAQYVGGAEVSTDYFGVLGVQPVVGRLFGPQDDEARRIVIGEGL